MEIQGKEVVAEKRILPLRCQIQKATRLHLKENPRQNATTDCKEFAATGQANGSAIKMFARSIRFCLLSRHHGMTALLKTALALMMKKSGRLHQKMPILTPSRLFLIFPKKLQ